MRVRAFFVVAVSLQLFFVIRGYWDPHKRFAFQMFHESSEWSAEVVRVTRDGKRVPIEQEFHGYKWANLVRCCGLRHLRKMHDAERGIGSTLIYFQNALDWVADNTPNDPDTRYYEARVTYFKNRRGPFHRVMTSKRRLE